MDIKFLIFSSRNPQELSPYWSNTDNLTNNPPPPHLPSKLNVSCIFIAFSDFQSKWLAGLWCEPRLALLYESFMLFSSQLFGCIWLGEVWGWPNGEATWRLQMFCFCICTAHQKQQAVPPWSLCHLGESRQQLLVFPGELFESCYEKTQVIFRQPSNAIISSYEDRSLLLFNSGQQAANLKTVI